MKAGSDCPKNQPFYVSAVRERAAAILFAAALLLSARTSADASDITIQHVYGAKLCQKARRLQLDISRSNIAATVLTGSRQRPLRAPQKPKFTRCARPAA